MPTAILPARTITLATFQVWKRHLLCLAFPLLTLGFVASGPHQWYAALLWLSPLPFFEWWDHKGNAARHAPVADAPAWPFDSILYVLVFLQLLNIGLLVRLFGVQSLWSIDGLIGVLLVGVNSGVTALVVAHELIHRREPSMRFLGRVLLLTVLYEHFYTEHVRGHHVHVGTDDDPATARYGETFWHFLRRTVPGQFRSAWRLETRRLGDEEMKLTDIRLLRSRVVHGLIGEGLLVLAIAVVGGPTALAVFILQAVHAIVCLEQVNYIEHWGLMRTARQLQPIDSWDTDSSFTLFALVGLSRHADHHAHPTRPFHQLRYHDETPKMPTGTEKR
jgi:alkane 1-monooxygenase